MKKNREFASLHNHSHFSFMDGISRPEEIVSIAKEKGLRSVALTDHGVMHGMADFYLHGKKQGVKTIYGVEAYAIDDLDAWKKEREETLDKKRSKEEDSVDEDSTEIGGTRRSLRKKGHIVLLAQNLVGLSNLFELTHLAHDVGMYVKPRVDKKMLVARSDGIIATSACMGGVISSKCWAFERGEIGWEEVVREAEIFKEIFKGRFFLEMQFNEIDSQRFINSCMVRLHEETGMPLIVATDSHYPNPDDWDAQEVLYMLRRGVTMATRGEWNFDCKQLYLKDGDEMWDSYLRFDPTLDVRLVEEAFENTLLIDSMVDDYEPDVHQRLPTIDTDDPFKTLGELSIKRMKERGLDKDEVYVERFLREMKLIKEKDFATYFLVMKDIICRAKEKMAVGPGRGSAAASLICYLNGITDLDPIKHNLMFERFINSERCFIEGTIVKTNRGFKSIEEVELGEWVLSHRNVYRRVLNVFSYEKNEKLVMIRYDNSQFTCTRNHRIMIIVDNVEQWMTAEDILKYFEKGEYLFLVNERHFPLEIENVKYVDYDGYVYDLEIEEDKSYQIFGIK